MILHNKWGTKLEEEMKKEYFQHLMRFVNEEYETKSIYPPKKDIFKALEVTDYDEVKVVILGQDPYHGPNQGEGLSFSVKEGVSFPPSLRNIFKERMEDIGVDIPTSGSLLSWAQQGVLLLNTVLTVEEGKAHSHKGKGWEVFTDKIISLLNEKETPIVFILWGKPAQSKKKLITNPIHQIIESVHPSPLSAHRGFFGSKPFSKTNELLRKQGQKEIKW